MSNNTQLTAYEVEIIKKRLWYGEDSHEIARMFKIGVGLIYNIRSGWRWEEIRWPDGSSGAISKRRGREIAKAGKEARRRYTSVILREKERLNELENEAKSLPV